MNHAEMRDEYDFSRGVRGKYAAAAATGRNVIRLDDDVAEFVHDAKQVNDLLRAITNLVKPPA